MQTDFKCACACGGHAGAWGESHYYQFTKGVYQRRLSCSTIACVVMIACKVRASEVSVTLDLQCNTPGNANSGGTWTAVAKADERGVNVG